MQRVTAFGAKTKTHHDLLFCFGVFFFSWHFASGGLSLGEFTLINEESLLEKQNIWRLIDVAASQLQLFEVHTSVQPSQSVRLIGNQTFV